MTTTHPNTLPKVKALSQYPTPYWFAQAIVDRYFADLDAQSFVIEPSCADGSFLHAIPDYVPAIGIDIDPVMVARARRNTNRTIIEGSFVDVELSVTPSLILGNPPFNLKLIEQFLARSHQLLTEGGRVGFILPTYAFQTAGRVSSLMDTWTISQEMIPRNVFHGLSLPLLFAIFTKELNRRVFGFAFYREVADTQQLPAEYRQMLDQSGTSVWLKVVLTAVGNLGGVGSLSQIYNEIEGVRPTKTQFWREQIRKTLRKYEHVFTPHGDGRYSFAQKAA